MLEDTVVVCPKCDTEINAKVLTSGRKSTYVVSEDCPNCKITAGKIERGLNSMDKKWGIKREKSYLKTDPRG